MSSITYLYKNRHMLTVYSAAHFLVDFSCAFLMFRAVIDTPNGYLCVLLYNFCAFAMQMPLGVLADKWNNNYLFSSVGCLLISLSFGFFSLPLAATILAGIGNGMFHVGGGIDVLNISQERSGALGIFVSPGAFGIYLGTMLGKGESLLIAAVPIALIATTALIVLTRRLHSGEYVNNTEFSIDVKNTTRVFAAVVGLFVVVCLRSYVGLTLSFPWKGVSYWGVALTCAVVFGKTLGGLASDSLGIKRTACFSLGLAAFLFLFVQIPVAGVLSILLFNMTMPITLFALAKVFPGAKGFSFGLLTFGLFIGLLPVYLGLETFLIEPWHFGIACALSLVLLLACLIKVKL